MVVVLGGRGTGGNRALDDNGVHKQAVGKNCGVCCREADLKTMYRHREDGGIKKVPKVVGPGTCPHTVVQKGRVKEKQRIV